MPSADRFNAETTRIVRLLEQTQFVEGLEIVRGFVNIPQTTGIYAFKHRSGELLYVGKASAFRTRFKGHQTLVAFYTDEIPVSDVRILLAPLTPGWVNHLEVLEKRVLFVLRPRYNSLVPTLENLEMMQLRTIAPAKVSELLNVLPDSVQDAIDDYANRSGLTEAQVLELALAQFLDLNTTSFTESETYPSLGALQERVKVLELLLKQRGGVPENLPIDLTPLHFPG